MTDSQEIYVLGKKVRLLQPGRGFRTSLDSVMAAAACPVKDGQRVLDMGCGVGAIGFCLLHRVPGITVTGIDIQQDYIALAERNIALNGAAGKASFLCMDIAQYRAELPFDHVVTNPPFLEAGGHTRSPVEGKALAMGHESLSLSDWIDAGFHNLRSGGSLSIIHRADALDKILQALGRRFGAADIIPLWPRAGDAAKRVIVRAVKDRRSPATLHAGIVLHKENGTYTDEADSILRDGAGLFLS